MTEHTQGPWRAEWREDGISICYAERGNIAKLYTWDFGSAPEQKANARLMAAAPELLAALRSALPTLRMRATEEARANKAPTGLRPSTTHREILAAAEAAIAKTETAQSL